MSECPKCGSKKQNEYRFVCNAEFDTPFACDDLWHAQAPAQDDKDKLIAKLKEENAHLKEELEMYSGYKEGDADE